MTKSRDLAAAHDEECLQLERQLDAAHARNDDLERELAALKPHSNSMTHWVDCWRARHHHECAIGRVEALEGELAAARGRIAELEIRTRFIEGKTDAEDLGEHYIAAINMLTERRAWAKSEIAILLAEQFADNTRLRRELDASGLVLGGDE